LTYPRPIIQALLLLIVIPAALFDSRQRRVPNWLALAGLLLGIGLNTFLYENAGFWTSLKGLGLAFLIYFPLYLLRGMGAGDVKLMAAVGAIAGPSNWLGIMVLTALFGGVAAIVLVTAKGRIRKTFENIRMILLSARHLQAPYDANPDLDVHSNQSLRLPHAVVIAFGTFGLLLAAGIWAPR
jgi:prepilin peptidase CpaA